MTPDVFIQNFPELAKVGPVLIAAKLAIAAAKMGGPAAFPWGPLAPQGSPPTIADAAHGYLAAALIWESPMGGATLLTTQKSKEKSHYRKEFEEIETALCQGGLVAGGTWPANPGLAVPAAGLTPGHGTVAVVNGSPNILFANPQTLAAGTLIIFTSTQPGVYYSLQANIQAAIAAVLSAAYGGPTAPNALWSY